MEKKESVIQSVVCRNQAQITRQAVLEVKEGDREFVFQGIPPQADADSFRVRASGQGEIQIQGIEIREEPLESEFSASQEAFYQELERIQHDLWRVEQAQKRLAMDRGYTESMKNYLSETLMGDFLVSKTGTEDLKRHVDRIEAHDEAHLKEGVELEKEKKGLLKQKERVQRQIQSLQSRPVKSRLHASVQFTVLQPGEIRMLLFYSIPGASWETFYDARLMPESSALELFCYAGVSQDTGEDWENIDLFLSTANPSREAALPPLRPHFLTLEPGVLDSPVSASLAQQGEGGTTVNFKIQKKETILSDGSRKKTLIDAFSLPVSIEYLLMPRESSHAYIRVSAANPKEYPLLPGEVLAFHGQDFAGHSSMPLTVPGENLNLYLGADDAIQVERELLNRLKTPRGFKNSQEQILFQYKTSVRNLKDRRVSILVLEPLPVSKNSEIKVKLEKSMPEFSLQDEESFLHWNLLLKPGETKEILFDFSVTWPSERRITGLE